LLRVRSLPPRGGREGPLRERPTGPPHAQGGGDVARARRAARTVGHEGGAAEDRLAGHVRGGEQPRPEHLDAAARAGGRRGGRVAHRDGPETRISVRGGGRGTVGEARGGSGARSGVSGGGAGPLR